MLPNLTLQQLAYLREYHRHGNVTAAARELGVAQPTLSQALAEIERRLGLGLFERRGRRPHFNEAGLRTVSFAEEVLGRAESLGRWLRDYREGRSGALNVGMIDAASLYVLPAAVESFRARYPEVELHLTVDRTAVLLDGLRSSALDLAFVVGPVSEEFRAVVLREEPLYLYGPPDGRDPAAVDWLLYRSGRQTRALIDSGLARLGIRPRVALESDSPEVLRQLVALGLGASVLPEGVAEAGATPLRRHRPEPVAHRTLLALNRTDAGPDRRAEAFLVLALASGEGGD